MTDTTPSRRRFLTAGLAGGALLINRAAGQDDDEPAIVALPLTEYEELSEVGGWTDEAELYDGTELIVAHVAEGKFIALSRKCTHENCNVEYDHENQRIACPCHKSMYGLDGRPTDGPARRPLQVYPCEMAVVVREADE